MHENLSQDFERIFLEALANMWKAHISGVHRLSSNELIVWWSNQGKKQAIFDL